MKYGFDPQTFHLHRQPAPDWADTARTTDAELPHSARLAVAEQQADIVEALEQVLQWAMTDPGAAGRFRTVHPYAEGVTGDYYIGRQHVGPSPDGPDRVIVETECCLTRPDPQRHPEVYVRYVMALTWNLTERSGQLLLASDTGRQTQLAVLPVRLTTGTLAEIPDLEHLDAADRDLLTRRWDETLACIGQAAQSAIEQCSSSGELDQGTFPSRIELTGNYSIGMAYSLPGDGGVLMLLRFTERKRQAGLDEEDALGYEVVLTVDQEDHLSYELWGMQAL